MANKADLSGRLNNDNIQPVVRALHAGHLHRRQAESKPSRKAAAGHVSRNSPSEQRTSLIPQKAGDVSTFILSTSKSQFRRLGRILLDISRWYEKLARRRCVEAAIEYSQECHEMSGYGNRIRTRIADIANTKFASRTCISRADTQHGVVASVSDDWWCTAYIGTQQQERKQAWAYCATLSSGLEPDFGCDTLHYRCSGRPRLSIVMAGNECCAPALMLAMSDG